MKALIYKSPGNTQIEDIETPVPDAHEVLLRIESVGICGSDVHGFAGETGRRQGGLTMGHEIIATVESLGDEVGVSAVARGTTVAVNPVLGCGACARCTAGLANMCDRRRVIGVDLDSPGGFAQFMVAPARNALPIAELQPQHALTEPFAVGLNAVRRARVVPGQSVLVIGAGVVGVACAWAAQRDQAGTVAASDLADARQALAEAVGIDTIPSGDESFEDRVLAHFGGEVDVVIDAVGFSSTLAQAIAVVKPGGTIVLVGMGAPSPALPGFDLITKQISLIGTWCYSDQSFEEALLALSSSGPRFTPMISGEVPLDEVAPLLRSMAAGTNASSKMLVTPNAS